MGSAGGPCLRRPVREDFTQGSSSRLTHSLGPSTSVFGETAVLGDSESCTEFTVDWEGEGGFRCPWTALPGRQERCLLLWVLRFSCVIALGNFPLLLIIFFLSNKLVLSKIGFFGLFLI